MTDSLETLVLTLQAHAKEQGWQDVDEPIAALLAWTPASAQPTATAVVRRALDNAVENGCADELARMSDEAVAYDLIRHDAECERLGVALVTASVRTCRALVWIRECQRLNRGLRLDDIHATIEAALSPPPARAAVECQCRCHHGGAGMYFQCEHCAPVTPNEVPARAAVVAEAPYRHRTIEELQKALRVVCDTIWYGGKPTGDHLWSIPVDQERDFDCILSDGIAELAELRKRLASAPPDPAPPAPDEHQLASAFRAGYHAHWYRIPNQSFEHSLEEWRAHRRRAAEDKASAAGPQGTAPQPPGSPTFACMACGAKYDRKPRPGQVCVSCWHPAAPAAHPEAP